MIFTPLRGARSRADAYNYEGILITVQILHSLRGNANQRCHA